MAGLTLWLPETIPAALSPNGDRAHWAKLNAGRQELRHACEVRITNALRERDRVPPLFERSLVSVTAFICRARAGRLHPAYRPEDVPNLVYALKPLYDALQDAGVIVNDDAEHMELGPHRIDVAPTFVEEGLLVVVDPVVPLA